MLSLTPTFSGGFSFVDRKLVVTCRQRNPYTFWFKMLYNTPWVAESVLCLLLGSQTKLRLVQYDSHNLNMAKNQMTEVNGVVSEALPNTQFRVTLEDGREILAHLAGKMRLYRIKVMPGDRVKLEMSPYDTSKGRIVFRQSWSLFSQLSLYKNY